MTMDQTRRAVEVVARRISRAAKTLSDSVGAAAVGPDVEIVSPAEEEMNRVLIALELDKWPTADEIRSKVTAYFSALRGERLSYHQ